MADLGTIVHYQTDERGGLTYALPAIIVRTQKSSDPNGPLPELAEDTVDLYVFSVEGASYGENAVPYDLEGGPRSWRFG